MNATRPTYQKHGGPPDNWASLIVYDLWNDCELSDVVECDTVKGYAIIQVRTQSVVGVKISHLRVEGKFAIRERRPPSKVRR